MGRDFCYNDSGESFGIRRFNMNLIVCVDPRGGMMFNKRRTTSDVLVTADILREAEGEDFLLLPTPRKFSRPARLRAMPPTAAQFIPFQAIRLTMQMKVIRYFLKT